MPINKQKSLAIGITFEELHGKYYIDTMPKKDMLLRVKTDKVKSTQEGCNVAELRIIPHCHGTHTETVAHVDKSGITIDKLMPPLGVPCQLSSIRSKRYDETDDTYPIQVGADEQVLDKTELQDKLSHLPDGKLEALALRTLPNDATKNKRTYKEINTYPFFTTEAVNYIRNLGVLHLLVDIPSIDRIKDAGMLSNHRRYWGRDKDVDDEAIYMRQHATITEQIYVPDKINDGFYFLYLCYPMIKTDAVPSWPILVQSIIEA
jgi:kynurenine formamidase